MKSVVCVVYPRAVAVTLAFVRVRSMQITLQRANCTCLRHTLWVCVTRQFPYLRASGGHNRDLYIQTLVYISLESLCDDLRGKRFQNSFYQFQNGAEK